MYFKRLTRPDIKMFKILQKSDPRNDYVVIKHARASEQIGLIEHDKIAYNRLNILNIIIFLLT